MVEKKSEEDFSNNFKMESNEILENVNVKENKKKNDIGKFINNSQNIINHLSENLKIFFDKIKKEIFSEKGTNEEKNILTEIKKKIDLKNLFEKLTKKMKILNVHNIKENLDKIEILEENEKKKILEVLNSNLEEELLLGDFIEILEIEFLKEEKIGKSRKHLFLLLSEKYEEFNSIIENFLENLKKLKNDFFQMDNFTIFSKIEKIKLEISEYISFYEKIFKKYFLESLKYLKEIKKNIFELSSKILKNINNNNLNNNENLEKNLSVMEKIKKNMKNFDNFKNSKNIKDFNYIKNAFENLDFKNQKLKNFFPKKFLNFRKKEDIVNDIKLNLIEDKKIRLVQKFVRKLLVSKKRKFFCFIVLICKKIEDLMVKKYFEKIKMCS